VKLTMLDILPGSSGDPDLEHVGRAANPKRPANRFWPAPYEVDQAINKRAQAMARTGKQFTRADSDDYADRLIRALYGRNAMVADSERDKIRRLLWNDYQDYPAGFKGFHRTAAGKRTERQRVKYMGVRPRANPNRSCLYGVTVPPSARDRGYYFTIRARTAGAALAEARRYCARNAGTTTAGYKLPRGSSAKELKPTWP
jgi:hypothetical protein